MSLFLIVLISLIITNTAIDRRQLLQGGDDTYEYVIKLNIHYMWINETAPLLSYDAVWSEINDLIKKQTDLAITDKTSAKQDLIYRNKSQSLSLKIVAETSEETRFEQYVDTNFGVDVQENINSIADSIEVKKVDISIKLISDHTGTMIGGAVGGVIFLCLCIACIIKQKQKRKLRNARLEFGKSSEEWLYNNGENVFGQNYNPFISGIYAGYYIEGKGGSNSLMNDINLKFEDDGMNNNVVGNGKDKIGDYKIDGIYSNDTKRIALNKIYIKGTGDLEENMGHTVKIRVIWNHSREAFEGKWYRKTLKYEGTGEWVISKHEDNLSDFINHNNNIPHSNMSNMSNISNNSNNSNIHMIQREIPTAIVYGTPTSSMTSFNIAASRSGGSRSGSVSKASSKSSSKAGTIIYSDGSKGCVNSNGGSGTFTILHLKGGGSNGGISNMSNIDELNEMNIEEALPNGWKMKYNDEKKVFYQHESTRETRWKRPTAENAFSTPNFKTLKLKDNDSYHL